MVRQPRRARAARPRTSAAFSLPWHPDRPFDLLGAVLSALGLVVFVLGT